MRPLLSILVLAGLVASAQTPAASALTREQKEAFLRDAKVIKARGTSKGITGTVRVTMTDGQITHDASVQTIDEQKARFEGTMGTEINFRDTWKFNVAGYKLACLLGLADMVPPSVERRYKGSIASFTWWVDEVQMDEGDRMRKKITPPNMADWNDQMFIVRVYDQLIYNTDRNLGNLLIDKQWNLWMIDHTRGFRLFSDLKEKKNLGRCDRALLERLKALDEKTCLKELQPYVGPLEIKGLLARRDKIVQYFELAGDNSIYTYVRKTQ